MGREKERVDGLKRQAFRTIIAIMGVLWVYFVGLVVCAALHLAPIVIFSDRCVVMVSSQQCSDTFSVSTKGR